MIVQAFVFSTLAFCNKLLLTNSRIHPFEIAYWYGWILLFLKYGTLKILKGDIMDIPVKARGPLIARGIFGYCGTAFYFVALSFISLSKASVIFQTSPMFTALMGRIMLKERLSYFDWAALPLSFLGLVLIQNPFGKHDDENSFTQDLLGTSAALIGSISTAILYISLRQLGIAGDIHFLLPAISFSLGAMFLSPIFLFLKLLFQPELNQYSWFDVGMILAISLCFYFVQIL